MCTFVPRGEGLIIGDSMVGEFIIDESFFVDESFIVGEGGYVFYYRCCVSEVLETCGIIWVIAVFLPCLRSSVSTGQGATDELDCIPSDWDLVLVFG